VQVTDGEKKKPDTVVFYKSKYGVDVVDKMSRLYTVRAASRRWPVHSFYNLLDLAGVNACVVYNALNTDCQLSRHQFLLKLGEELVENYLAIKLSNARADAQNFQTLVKKRSACVVR